MRRPHRQRSQPSARASAAKRPGSRPGATESAAPSAAVVPSEFAHDVRARNAASSYALSRLPGSSAMRRLESIQRHAHRIARAAKRSTITLAAGSTSSPLAAAAPRSHRRGRTRRARARARALRTARTARRSTLFAVPTNTTGAPAASAIAAHRRRRSRRRHRICRVRCAETILALRSVRSARRRRRARCCARCPSQSSPPLGIARARADVVQDRRNSLADERDMIAASVRHDRAQLARDAIRDGRFAVAVGHEEHARSRGSRISGTARSPRIAKRPPLRRRSPVRCATRSGRTVPRERSARRPRTRGCEERIVAVSAEQQIDARNARGELAIEATGRRARARPAGRPSGTPRGDRARSASHGSRKRQPKTRSHALPGRILHDQQAENVHARRFAARRALEAAIAGKNGNGRPLVSCRFVQTSGWRMRAARARSSPKR